MPAIDDGYNVPFFLKGVKGLYPDLHGTRRPTLTRERNAAQQESFKKNTPSEILGVFQRFCAAKLVSWDATTDHTVKGRKSWGDTSVKEGDTLPVGIESFDALEPELWDALCAVLMGFRPGDEPPNATKSEKSEFELMLAGDAPADDTLLEAARKNSPTA